MTLADQVAGLAASDLAARPLRAAMLDLLRPVIPFDAYVFVLTDPRTSVGSDPLADVPLLDRLPQAIRLKYATAANRWTTLTDPPVGLLSSHPAISSHPCAEWRALLGAAGIVDVASVVFRDRYGCWGVRAQTGQTGDYLRRLLPTPEGRSPVPAAAYHVAAQLLAVEAGVDDHPAEAAVHLGGGVWVTLRARETELLRVIADGVDTREAAARMFLSRHTVQDHLKSIFDKTGSRSRRELRARCL